MNMMNRCRTSSYFLFLLTAMYFYARVAAQLIEEECASLDSENSDIHVTVDCVNKMSYAYANVTISNVQDVYLIAFFYSCNIGNEMVLRGSAECDILSMSNSFYYNISVPMNANCSFTVCYVEADYYDLLRLPTAECETSLPPADCRFEYRKQPPSATLDECNPYQIGSNTVSISLECLVNRRAMVTDEYEVRWFRENTAGAVEDLGLGDPNQMLDSDWLSRYHNTAFFNQSYSPGLLGKYWCQVINTTADPDQPLMRSNVFTLLAPDEYSGPPCTNVQEVVNNTCADQIDVQNSIKPTSSLPFQLTSSQLQQTPSGVTAVALSSYTKRLLITYTTAEQSIIASSTIASTALTAPDSGATAYALPAGASAGGVLLVTVLFCFSVIIVILIVIKKRKATAGELNDKRKNTQFSQLHLKNLNSATDNYESYTPGTQTQPLNQP